MLKRIIAVFAVFALAGSLLLSADGADPRKVYQSLAAAISAADAAAIKSCMTIAPQREKLLDLLVQGVLAKRHLRDAAKARFNEEGSDIVGGDGTFENDIQRKASRVNEAQLKIEGDSATLTILTAATEPAAEQPEPEVLHFRKVGGEWKVDAMKVLGAEDDKQADDFQQYMAKFVEIWEGLAAEIKAGKYKTAAEAKDALSARYAEAVGASTSQPAEP